MTGLVVDTTPNTTLSSQRALDFFESRYRSLDSLVALDDVVAQVELENNQLGAQLSQSTAELDQDVERALSQAHELLSSARDLSIARHSLADDLTALNHELVTAASKTSRGSTKTLLQELEELHGKLEELEETRTYVRIIEQAMLLSEAAVDTIKAPRVTSSTFSRSSLDDYGTLQDFVSSVISACNPANSNSEKFQLPVFLRALQNRTWKNIKAVLTSNLLAAAEKIQWPTRLDYASLGSSERNDFETMFNNLLRLQEFGEKITAGVSVDEIDAKEKHGIYPLQALVYPIAARFKFHFEGTRPTNRLDKPEWYLTNILNTIHEHRSFMQATIQDLLNKSIYKDIDASREFTQLLLPILTRKLRRTIPTLLPHPSLLAHTIYQTLIFDGSLRDDGFTLQNTSSAEKLSPVGEWEGLTDIILGKKEWFDAWLAGEKKFADDSYNEIISAPDAWLILDDGHDDLPGDTEIRPTASARRVKALIEQVTDRYQPLPRFTHRAHFLITIQIPILEVYHGRISSSLDAYETLSSSFMRAVPGALAGQVGFSGADGERRRLTSGVEGLGRLFKAYVSARFVGNAMETWGEELFFLELWTEINEKSALRIKAAAQPSLPSTTPLKDNATVEGTLFDELVMQYDTLAGRAEDMMINQICHEVESELRGYFSSPWEQGTDEVPPSLLRPLSVISSSLSFLARSLPVAPLSASYKRIAAHISAYILQRLIHHRVRGRFTSQDGKQFLAECKLWIQSSEMGLNAKTAHGVRRPESAWTRLVDAARLLSVEEGVYESIAETVFEGQDSEYEGILEMLGIEGVLERAQARDILRARVETWH